MLTTEVSQQEDKRMFLGVSQGVDVAHTERLSRVEHRLAADMAGEFVDLLQRYVDEAYVHMDVKKVREQRRGVPGVKWKVLLVTNKGRYHTEQMGFGVEHSLKQAFDVLEQQVRSRLERLDTK